ncbi:enoyl-CoA hydratase/isomerase family protein [Gordonia bronchialis]|uniref:enoyl-CoA hydratase/isomerase family protein n=1 Tax=Gordonia bronchialis TaxID=2054 RepID=UPI001CBD763F|nr:enoyl-CoA hydratase/isomerase family protein [Gordonia bronchialis]
MSVVDVAIADGIGYATLNRPQQMNAVTAELGRELAEAIGALGDSADVNVIVIRGAGGNFCAGGDFAEVERLRADGPDALRPLFENFRDACGAVSTCPVPVVALVEGVAMAGGFELMQAADVVLVSDDARISDNHIRFGQIPGGGSTQRLPRLVGRQQALGLLLSGDRLSGLDAQRLGLAYRSWPAAEFDGEADAFVSKLAGRDRSAVTKIKSLVHQGLSKSLDDGLDLELDAVVGHISGDAGSNGVATFATRRQ